MSMKWEETREVWLQGEQEETMSVSAEVLSYLEKGTGQLDTDVAHRRRMEWLACLVAMGIAAAVYATANNVVQVTGAILFSAAAILIGGYHWFSGRPMSLPDPATSLVAYRATLAAKFDRQIRLLRQGKYWSLAPLLALIT